MNTILVLIAAYLAIGALVLRHHWQHPEEPELDQLKDMATRMRYRESELLISHKMATGIGTVLAFFVVLPVWPITLIPRKRQKLDPEEVKRLLHELETARHHEQQDN